MTCRRWSIWTRDRVQSITMLKDASATAIYGSKASNGVIVIETYTPKPGEINVSYGGNLRLQMPDLSAYNLMDAEEKIQVEALAGLYSPNDLDSQRDYQNRLREVKEELIRIGCPNLCGQLYNTGMP